MTSKGIQARSALDLIEEAFRLLRTGPFAALAVYYVGALPFTLALVYFWADMSQSPFARDRLALGALLLAVLFVWMKTCHVFYARRLLAAIDNVPPSRLTFGQTLRIATTQTVIHTTGFFVLPIAAVILMPLPTVYAFYQNVTALDDGRPRGGFDLAKEATRESLRAPTQALVLMWILSPFALLTAFVLALLILPVAGTLAPEWFRESLSIFAVLFFEAGLAFLILFIVAPFALIIFANLAIMVGALPELLRIFFGIETYLTQSGAGANSSTFLVLICALAFLIMDPLAKAAYVLRCYYGAAIATGQDLRTSLRRLAGAGKIAAPILIIGGSLFFAASAGAQERSAENVVAIQDLNSALDVELGKADYLWRLPLERNADEGIVEAMLRSIAETVAAAVKVVVEVIGDIIGWFFDLFRPSRDMPQGALSSVTSAVRIAIYVLIALLAASVVYLIYRSWRVSRKRGHALATPVMVLEPDLEDEDLAADTLPEDEWWRMAKAFMEQGDYRLALRAFFLSTLAFLAKEDLIAIARFKSNRDYQAELERHAHAVPALHSVFRQSVRTFEAAWYGLHTISAETLQQFVTEQESLRVHGH